MGTTFEALQKIAEGKGASSTPPNPSAHPETKTKALSFSQLQTIASQPAKQPPSGPSLKEKLFGKPDTVGAVDASGKPVMMAHDPGAIGRAWENFKLLHIAPQETIGEAWERSENFLGRSAYEQEQREQDQEKVRQDFVNSVPNISLYSPYGTINAHSAISAASDVGSALKNSFEGLLSPQNVLLMAFGMGKAEGAEVAAPTKIASTVSRLAHFAFTSQMAMGLYDQAKGSFEAFMHGDADSGIQMAVEGLVSGYMAGTGAVEGRARTEVVRELEGQSDSRYGKSWYKLSPEQKAHVVYEASRTKGIDLEHAKREGLQPPPANVSGELDDLLKQHASDQQDRDRNNQLLVSQAYKQRVADMDEAAKQRQKEKVEEDRVAARRQEIEQQQKLQALQPAPRTTALDREFAAHDARVQDARDLYEQEKAREEERSAGFRLSELARTVESSGGNAAIQESVKQTLQNAGEADLHKAATDQEIPQQARTWATEEITRRQSLSEEQAQEEAAKREPTLNPTQDQRANAPYREAILAAIEEGRAARTREADVYAEQTDQLRMLGEQIRPGREIGMIHEQLRIKEQNFNLSPEEQSFMQRWRRRNEMERQLLKTDKALPPDIHAALTHTEQLRVQNILSLARQEQEKRMAAATFRKQAVKANTPEDVERLMEQAQYMEGVAERLQAEREEEQAIRSVQEKPDQKVEQKPRKNIVMGNAGTLHLVGVDNVLPIRYGAIRLSDIVLSHDPWTFEINPRFGSQEKQPRKYHSNAEAQTDIRVNGKPENFKMERLVSDDPTSQQGPPVLFLDGEDISGNGRMMRFARAWRDADATQKAEMSDALWSGFSKFGIDLPDRVDEDDPWIPARFLMQKPENLEDLVRMGADLNRDHMMGLSEEESAVSAGQRLTRDDIGTVAAWMEQIPEDATMADLLLARGSQIADLMVERGVIAPNKRAGFFNSKGELTNDAKSLFSSLIMGKVIDDADLLSTAPPEQMQKLERSMLPLVEIQAANPDWQIADYLKEALRVWKEIAPIRSELNKIGTDKDSLVDKLLRPQDFKGGMAHLSPRPPMHPITEALAKLLEKPTKETRDALSKYGREAEGKQASLTGPRDPRDVFNESVGKATKVEVSSSDWQTAIPATEEQKAADAEATKPLPKPAKGEKRRDPVAMDPLPGLPEEAQGAAQELIASIGDGTVTPDSLKKLFRSDKRTRDQADALMKIFGEWIPRATGQSLPDFLRDHVVGVDRIPQAESEALDPAKWNAGLPPPSWSSVETFAPDSPKKGLVRWMNDGRALIQLFEGHDATTVLHEFFHVVRRYVTPQDMAALEKAFAPDGIWSRDSEEIAARTWEKYFADGHAPTEELKSVFAKLKEVFRKVYFYLAGKHYKLREDAGLRHPDSGKPIILKPEVRATFDRWLGAEPIESPPAEAQTAVRPTEIMPPPESIETAITPQEREGARLIANGNPENSLLSRMGDSRAKRFDSFEDARDWAVRNKDNLWALELWQTREGKTFAEFVPNDLNKPLFQVEPLSYAGMVKRLDELRMAVRAMPDAERQGRMRAEIHLLEQKLGVKEEGLLSPFPTPPVGQSSLFAAPPPATGSIILTGGERPDLRPPAEPDKATTLFVGTGEKKRDVPQPESARRLSDEAVRVQKTPGHGGVDEPSQRPTDRRPDLGPVPGRPDTARAGRRSGRDRGADLSNVAPAQIVAPTRMRGPATVSDAQWQVRMAELRMPQGLPAPTVRIHGSIAAQLIFPGQVEVAESGASTLQQFDAVVIGTPGGTGKTFTALAIVKQRLMDGDSRRVIVVVPSENIAKQRDGWIYSGKNKFGIEIKEAPLNLNNLPEGVYWTTYDRVRVRGNLSKYKWDLMVTDEVHAARRWWESQRGPRVRELSDNSAKAIYVSATPFHTAAEVGYLTKLGLWAPGEFENWAKQFGAKRSQDGPGWTREGNEPARLVKLREQLVGRGQFITQEESYEGYTADMAVVPITQQVANQMADIRHAFRLSENFYLTRGKKGDIERARSSRALAVTYMKAYLERQRLPELIQMLRQSIQQGWHPLIFSDTVSAREEIYDYLQDADAGLQGQLSRMIPPLEDIYKRIADEFGEKNVANFSGPASAKREEEKNAFNRGEKRLMFLTYAAGSEGMNAHDTSQGGVRPRMPFYLGPPYNGFKFEQSLKRPWRFGAKSDVHAVFLASNARPELKMLYSKIAPRLESLRAVVQGVDADHRVIKAMKGLNSWHEGLVNYDLGETERVDAADFQVEREDAVPIQNWKAMQMPSAEQAKGRGMKYPGMSDDKPGVISLFQKGEFTLPPRFLNQEEAQAQLHNEEVMQALADGDSVPVLGDRVAEIDPGDRRLLADATGPTVTEQIENRGSFEPSARAAEALHTSFTQILADQEAGRITVAPGGEGGGPEWSYETKATPPPDDDETPTGFRSHKWLLSGQENIASIERQYSRGDLNISRDLTEYQAQWMNVAGELQHEFLTLMRDNKIDKKEFPVVWMVKEGKMPAPNQRVARMAQGLTDMLNRIRQEAADAGLYTTRHNKNGKQERHYYADMADDPNYMPHKHDFKKKITLVDPETGEKQVFTIGQLLKKDSMGEIKRDRIMASIEAATGWTKAQTEDWLDKSRRVKVAGSIERTREADFPFYRMDPGVMFEYFQEFGESKARAKYFGQDLEKLDGKIAQIPNAKARKLIKSITTPLTSPRAMSPEVTRWYGPIATAAVIGKMTFSTLKVPFHYTLSTPLILQEMAPVLRGMMKAAIHPMDARDFAIYSGALARNVLAESALDRTSEMKLASQWLSAQGFNAAVKVTRTLAAFTARDYMNNSLPKLQRRARSSERIRGVLKDKLLLSDYQIETAMERGQWSKDDLSRGAAALVNRGLFTDDPTEMPPMSRLQSDDPMHDDLDAKFRLASVLHSYSFKVAMLIKRDVIAEARKGNLRPLTMLLLAEPAVGMALRGTAAAARTILSLHPPPGQKTPWQKYQAELEDLFEHPTIAKMVHEWIDDLGMNTGWTIISHVFDVLAFPPKNLRQAKYQQKNLALDVISEAAGVAARDFYNTLNTMFQMVGDAATEHGPKLKRDEANLGLQYLREESPLLRGLVPPKLKGTYDMAPPP